MHDPIFDRWHGDKRHKPDVSNLCVFGSVAFMFIPDSLRQKLDPIATKGVYVGESEEQKASRIFIDSTGRMHVTRHINFMKTYLIGHQLIGHPPLRNGRTHLNNLILRL